MPTLVAALTLAALLRIAHLELPRWHLAFWFALLVGLALRGLLPTVDLVLNVLGSFAAAWLYFGWLDHTDNRRDRAVHWLVLIGGFVLLVGSRFLLDIRMYGISF